MATETKSSAPFVWRVSNIPASWSELHLIHGISRSFECRESTIECISYEPAVGREPVERVATLRFTTLPALLHGVTDKAFRIGLGNGETAAERYQLLTIDRHFEGLTALYSPPDGRIAVNILALSGLGSHPYGSFVHKESGVGHMWLQSDIRACVSPAARVVIYGYDTRLENNDSFATLEDLAKPVAAILKQFLAAGPLTVLAHSLGGLLVQEAILQIAESDENDECNLLSDLLAVLFFGVPSDGMLTDPLSPLVEGRPNQPLVQELNRQARLGDPKRRFAKVFEDFKVWCFYEIKLSPTVVRDPVTGKICYSTRDEDKRAIVDQRSATFCLREYTPPRYSVPLQKTHSDLVKLSPRDTQAPAIMDALAEACRPALSSWLGHVDAGSALLERDEPGALEQAKERFQWALDACHPSSFQSGGGRRGADSTGLICANRGLVAVHRAYVRRGSDWRGHLSAAHKHYLAAVRESRLHAPLACQNLQLDRLSIQVVELLLLAHAKREDLSRRSRRDLERDLLDLEKDVERKYIILPQQHRFRTRLEGLLAEVQL